MRTGLTPRRLASADALLKLLTAGIPYREAYRMLDMTRDEARHNRELLYSQGRLAHPNPEGAETGGTSRPAKPAAPKPILHALPVIIPSSPALPKGAPTSSDTFDEGKGVWDGVRVTDRAPKSLPELLELFKVDTQIWSVSTWGVKSWEMGYKDKDDVGQALPLYAINARFQRNPQAVAARSDIQEMLREAKAQMPLYVPSFRIAKPNSLRCVLLTPENHFGKHCWGAQTGTDYDLNIALAMHWDGLHRLLHKISVYDIERFTFACGNDLQNSDNSAGTTFAGTPQDNDGRFPKVFTATRKAMTGSIDTLLQIADVKVIMVGGNHDQDTNYCLGDALDCRYENNPSVEIDNSPAVRKYDEFGRNLHGFTHGDKQKITDLPLQMAQDESEAFGRTKWREWFTGHMHGMKLQDIKGVVVRTISSLSGTDTWHSDHGYTHNRRAWEAFLYDAETGMVASAMDLVQ